MTSNIDLFFGIKYPFLGWVAVCLILDDSLQRATVFFRELVDRVQYFSTECINQVLLRAWRSLLDAKLLIWLVRFTCAVNLCTILHVLHSQIQTVVLAPYVTVLVQKLDEKSLTFITEIILDDGTILLALFLEAEYFLRAQRLEAHQLLGGLVFVRAGVQHPFKLLSIMN